MDTPQPGKFLNTFRFPSSSGDDVTIPLFQLPNIPLSPGQDNEQSQQMHIIIFSFTKVFNFLAQGKGCYSPRQLGLPGLLISLLTPFWFKEEKQLLRQSGNKENGTLEIKVNKLNCTLTSPTASERLMLCKQCIRYC